MNIEFSQIPLAPIATVVAALIAALISFVNLTLSKEQKTSEFRQAWIDGLREELATLFSSARALCRTMQEARSPNSKAEDVRDFRFGSEQIGKIRLAGADSLYRVKLRLNKNETEHKELLRLLEVAVDTQNKINIEKGGDYTPALDAIERAASYSQDILKNEWERVKSGERSFQVTKNLVMPAIMIVSLIFISLLLFNSTNKPNKTIQSTANASAD
jgi:DNA mismatch repair ATPase MutS